MPPLVGSMNGGDIHRLYDKYKELILIIDVSRGWENKNLTLSRGRMITSYSVTR